ncbi:hypothetical protein CPLU01_05052 [Colletotrichum plurivorum]|uniref:Uncharacterized protein n=1 Tax=Colletotrichum plurivorum TaxID=2175906 RepID=A0A8H6NIZ7_9PEZI|nr:hypothetical protein CPLU01_05052 [Colletotrichum plurivorum]
MDIRCPGMPDIIFKTIRDAGLSTVPMNAAPVVDNVLANVSLDDSPSEQRKHRFVDPETPRRPSSQSRALQHPDFHHINVVNALQFVARQ